MGYQGISASNLKVTFFSVLIIKIIWNEILFLRLRSVIDYIVKYQGLGNRPCQHTIKQILYIQPWHLDKQREEGFIYLFLKISSCMEGVT